MTRSRRRESVRGIAPALRGLAAFAALAGCSYQDADSAPQFVINTCTAETACGRDSECRDGMCVARSADVPLTVVLQVSPVRMPDGSEPQPIVLDRFTVDGPMNRTFELPMPVTVTGFVRTTENAPIEADVSFTPVDLARGVPVASVTATTSIAAPNSVDTPDYVVQLLPGVEYRVAVQPSDPALPPQHSMLMVQADQELHVDYAAAANAYTRSYEIIGGPTDRPLIVRAFDRVTSELVSSTATVTAGRAELRFVEEPAPFRLEIRAAASYDGEQRNAADMWCDSSTPIFPVFTFESDELTTAAGNEDRIVLPPLPERIRFEGTVALCDAAEQAQAMPGAMEDAAALPVENLRISLSSRRLLDNDGLPLSAEFDATTTATRDQASGELHFCVQVMPGEYDVLATPALSVPCSLFAEHRLISAPEGENASGPLLELPAAAYLKGTVQKLDLSPLSHADVEAVALGRSEGITLEASDRSVTRYNRSRQTASGNSGEFELPVDLGSYDVMIKPPSGAGFSWQVRHDVAIGKRDWEFPTVIDMHSPIILNGTLVYRRDDTPLEGAEITAFAVVEDEFDTERAIPIGRTTADADGEFMLLLPASLQKGW